jgi:hypothetical protein
MVIAFKAWPGLGSKCGRAASDDGQPRGGVGGQDQHPVRRVPPEEDVREEGVGGGCVWSTSCGPTATTSAGSGGTRSCWLERGGYNRSSASGTKADDPESRELAF